MKPFAIAAAVLGLSVGAHAETWRADVVLVPNPSVTCVDVSFAFELTVDNGILTLKTPRNETHSAPVAVDGTVSLQFTGRGVIGTVVVSGNALTKELQLTAPRSLPGCRYALRPGVPAGAAAETRVQWRTSIQQVSGNVQTCGSGNRGSALVVGSNLFLYDHGYQTSKAYLAARLNPDGSFDGDVRTAYGNYSVARLKVSPGSGPRVIEYTYLTSVCTYRVVPD